MIEIGREKAYLHDLSGECTKKFSRFFICSTCKKVHKITLGCHSRWEVDCPTCAKKWRVKMRSKYRAGVQRMKRPKLLTLTLWHPKGSSIPAKQFEDLWKMRHEFFRQLRRGKRDYEGNWIRKPYKIDAWCGCLEPPNHIHLIIDSEYLPQHELVELWHSITGDSMIVDIRAITSRGRAANYVTKYITKTKDWTEQYSDLMVLKSLRICQSDKLQLFDKSKPDICDCGKADLHPTYTSEYYDTLEYEEWEKANSVSYQNHLQYSSC